MTSKIAETDYERGFNDGAAFCTKAETETTQTVTSIRAAASAYAQATRDMKDAHNPVRNDLAEAEEIAFSKGALWQLEQVAPADSQDTHKMRLLLGLFIQHSREMADDYDGFYQHLVDCAKSHGAIIEEKK